MSAAARLVAAARGNPATAALLDLLPGLGLNQGFLTAGCLFQEVWNRQAGHPPGWGIKDHDVFYFDDSDLSFEAEDAVIRRVRAASAHLGLEVEVRNQARVHLWYPRRFGPGYPQLRSARDGIDRYLVSCTCIGIELATGAIHAPNGLVELEAGILRPNPMNHRPDLFRAKAESYRARWPFLTIED
ncbi:nucleotidyltransferase family protein [Falsiroseomonas sp.]|uniref:nucleotidyltransferase family protein n=1 Tax=Falsiroseomonas sp. TaxID=2870721 RepID=UPI003F72042E